MNLIVWRGICFLRKVGRSEFMAVREAVRRVHPRAFFVKNRSLSPPPTVEVVRLLRARDGSPVRALVWRGEQVGLSVRSPAVRRATQAAIEASTRALAAELQRSNGTVDAAGRAPQAARNGVTE